MFSPQESSGKGSKRESLNLNLSVRGASAPIYPSPLKTFREYKPQRHGPQERKKKEFPFPVEKIVYLSERLELTSLSEKKIKSVSLSTVDIKGRNSSREVLPPRGQEGPSVGVSLSGFDFSLDLSSISNTGESSDDECIIESPHYNSESASALPSCETSRVATCPSRREAGSHPLSSDDARPPPRTSDLINVYVNSGEDQKDLVKYFRPCRTCQELCCVCPDSPSVDEGDFRRNGRDKVCTYGKLNKAVETDVSVTEFSCECSSCPAFRKSFRELSCCCPNAFDTDFFQPACGVECKCRSEEFFCSESDDSVASTGSGIVTSSLANAARSARVLARDLEIILSALNTGTE